DRVRKEIGAHTFFGPGNRSLSASRDVARFCWRSWRLGGSTVWPVLPFHSSPITHHAFKGHPSQLQRPRPMMSSFSFPGSHGSSSVNIVTHCFQDVGMRVMSVPQNMR